MSGAETIVRAGAREITVDASTLALLERITPEMQVAQIKCSDDYPRYVLALLTNEEAACLVPLAAAVAGASEARRLQVLAVVGAALKALQQIPESLQVTP